MSEFQTELKKARARQRRFFFMLTGGAGAAALLLLGFFVLTRGVSVFVEPSDAADGLQVEVLRGPGFIIDNTAYALYGELLLRVSSQGFISEEVSVGRDGRRALSLSLQEAPGKLVATALPPDPETRWLQDDTPVGTGAELSLELEAGRYTITAESPYRRKASLPLDMVRGAEQRIELALPPVPGRLVVESTPCCARLSVNGEAQGQTPLSLETPGGKYELVLELDGYQVRRETVRLTASAPLLERNYRLLREDAFVGFELEPPGGRLLLDGKQLHGFERVRVAALTSHRAIYHKDGYRSETQSFTLEPAQSTRLVFRLKEELGVVHFSATPSARISIGGQDMGETPGRFTLRATEQVVTFSRPGYRELTRRVTPSSASEKRVTVTLIDLKQALEQESPERYRNPAGITMKLFRGPGSVKMGAPRSEKGQRANEFERRVRLVRPFYAALHETTVAQFNSFSGAGAKVVAGNHPVTGVSWEDVARFCNRLSEAEGLVPFYVFAGARVAERRERSNGYRLPGEAEWEWLARAAGRRTQTRFTWGEETKVPPKSGNLADESARGTTPGYIPDYRDGFPGLAPVGSFPAEASGLHDLSGNVKEWMHESYGMPAPPTPGGPVETDPLGSARGDAHLVKGSSWRSSSLTELRASFRKSERGGGDDIGFRVVRYLYGDDIATTPE